MDSTIVPPSAYVVRAGFATVLAFLLGCWAYFTATDGATYSGMSLRDHYVKIFMIGMYAILFSIIAAHSYYQALKSGDVRVKHDMLTVYVVKSFACFALMFLAGHHADYLMTAASRTSETYPTETMLLLQTAWIYLWLSVTVSFAAGMLVSIRQALSSVEMKMRIAISA